MLLRIYIRMRYGAAMLSSRYHDDGLVQGEFMLIQAAAGWLARHQQQVWPRRSKHPKVARSLVRSLFPSLVVQPTKTV